MTQHIKVPAAQTNKKSTVTRSHMVEVVNQLPQAVL